MAFATAFRRRWAGDTEFGQAVVRLPVGIVCVLYYLWALHIGLIQAGPRQVLISCLACGFFAIALPLFWHVARNPGTYLWRRILAMLLDFSAAGTILTAGDEATLPLFGAMLWITVGYGIRYGGRYLIASGICAQVTMAIAIATSSYLQQKPFLAAALMITLLIGPSYAFALIHRLQLAYAAASAASAQKSHLVAQVSHDVRQPIHAISLLTSRLGDTRLTDEQAVLVTRIERSVSAAIQQLQTFLNITTIEAGLLKPALEPIHVGELLEAQVAQHQPMAVSVGNAIRTINTSYAVECDPIYLATIIQNLLANAVKHAPGSDILIGCRRTGRTLSICVYDRGPGIDANQISKLTDSYYRAGPQLEGQMPGAGLGLAIVRKLCDELGLTVEIVSRKGSGTAVWIKGLTLTAGPLRRPAEQTAGTFSQLAGIRVALVDDDIATLEATRELLRRWGCEVETFLHPSVQIRDCDILISDFEFADGSTAATHHDLWSDARPVIIVSGHSRELVSLAPLAHVIAILEKPVRASELRSALMAAKLSMDG